MLQQSARSKPPANPMLFVTPAGRACAEAVLRAVTRWEEKTLAEVVDAVRNDFGSVTERTVSRYLALFARRGVIIKLGENVPYLYRKQKVGT
jgi:hypothetical protein